MLSSKCSSGVTSVRTTTIFFRRTRSSCKCIRLNIRGQCKLNSIEGYARRDYFYDYAVISKCHARILPLTAKICSIIFTAYSNGTDYIYNNYSGWVLMFQIRWHTSIFISSRLTFLFMSFHMISFREKWKTQNVFSSIIILSIKHAVLFLFLTPSRLQN